MAQAPSTWPDERQLDDLVQRFECCQLLKAEWTHVAHLSVGTWYVARFGEAEALERLRSGIQRLNVSLGGENTDSAGYHETITRAYVRLLGDFLERSSEPDTAATVRSLLASPLASTDVLLRFYSRERLMSVTARRGAIEADLRPISAAVP